VISAILSARRPPGGLSLGTGVLRLSKLYGNDRLEAVCQRADQLHISTFKSIESMLKNNLDDAPLLDELASTQLPLLHENIPGREYYH
jgi:hypothetical protein